MELLNKLGDFNDFIWEHLLKFFKPVTDNVWLITIIFSILFALLIGILLLRMSNRLLEKDRDHYNAQMAKRYAFLSFPIYGFVLSIGYMIDRLPMIHQRIQTALSTTASIIMSSDSYSQAFEHVSKIKIDGSLSIAEFLYYNVINANPFDLYEHLYSALDKTRKIPIIRVLNIDSSIHVSIILLCMIIIIGNIWGIIGLVKMKKSFWNIYLTFNGCFLLYLGTRNCGAVFSFLLVQFIIHAMIFCFREDFEGKVDDSGEKVACISEKQEI